VVELDAGARRVDRRGHGELDGCRHGCQFARVGESLKRRFRGILWSFPRLVRRSSNLDASVFEWTTERLMFSDPLRRSRDGGFRLVVPLIHRTSERLVFAVLVARSFVGEACKSSGEHSRRPSMRRPWQLSWDYVCDTTSGPQATTYLHQTGG
jgi:hypothetical protein